MLIGMCFYHAGILWLSLFKTASAICPSGTKLFDLPDGTQDCKFCSDCPRGSVIVHNCSIYKDTVCKQACEHLEYYMDSEPHCRSCTVCEPGQYIVRNCSRFDDSDCEKCPEGRFSGHHNATSCTKCDGCEETGTDKACMPTRDSVCKDSSKTVIIGVVVGTVVLVLLISLLLVMWKRGHLFKRTREDDHPIESSPMIEKDKGSGSRQKIAPSLSKLKLEDEQIQEMKKKLREHKNQRLRELEPLTRHDQLKKLSLCVCKLKLANITESAREEKDKRIKHQSDQTLDLQAKELEKTLVSSEEYNDSNDSQKSQDVCKRKISASDKTFSTDTENSNKILPVEVQSNNGQESNKEHLSQDQAPTCGPIHSAKLDKPNNTVRVELSTDKDHGQNTENRMQDEETGNKPQSDQVSNTNAEPLVKSSGKDYKGKDYDRVILQYEKDQEKHTSLQKTNPTADTSNVKVPLKKECVIEENHPPPNKDNEPKPTNNKSLSVSRRHLKSHITKPFAKIKSFITSDEISNTKTSLPTNTMAAAKSPEQSTCEKNESEAPYHDQETASDKTDVEPVTATFVGSEYIITSYSASKMLIGSTEGGKLTSCRKICIEYFDKESEELVSGIHTLETVYENDTLDVAVLQLQKPLGNNNSLFLCNHSSAENQTRFDLIIGRSQVVDVKVLNRQNTNVEFSSFLKQNLREFEGDLKKNGKTKLSIENYNKCVAMFNEHSQSKLFWTSENSRSPGTPGFFFSDLDNIFWLYCVTTTPCPQLYDVLSENLREKLPVKYRLQMGTYMSAVYDDMTKKNRALAEALFYNCG